MTLFFLVAIFHLNAEDKINSREKCLLNCIFTFQRQDYQLAIRKFRIIRKKKKKKTVFPSSLFVCIMCGFWFLVLFFFFLQHFTASSVSATYWILVWVLKLGTKENTTIFTFVFLFLKYHNKQKEEWNANTTFVELN